MKREELQGTEEGLQEEEASEETSITTKEASERTAIGKKTRPLTTEEEEATREIITTMEKNPREDLERIPLERAIEGQEEALSLEEEEEEEEEEGVSLTSQEIISMSRKYQTLSSLIDLEGMTTTGELE